MSLTAGSKFVDLSQHPAVIQARFESSDGRLGGLNVNADVALDGIVVASVSLTDTGTMSIRSKKRLADNGNNNLDVVTRSSSQVLTYQMMEFIREFSILMRMEPTRLIFTQNK